MWYESCLTLSIFPIIFLFCIIAYRSMLHVHFIFRMRKSGNVIPLLSLLFSLLFTLFHTILYPLQEWFYGFCFLSFSFFFLREKIHRDFVNTEYTFDSILPHCFPYILANNWYYLALILILIFFCQPVKECVIVLFLISLIAREFKCFFTDLLTIQFPLYELPIMAVYISLLTFFYNSSIFLLALQKFLVYATLEFLVYFIHEINIIFNFSLSVLFFNFYLCATQHVGS